MDNLGNNKQLFVCSASTGKGEHARTGLGEASPCWVAGGSGSVGTHSAPYRSALTNNLLQDAQVKRISLHHLQCS